MFPSAPETKRPRYSATPSSECVRAALQLARNFLLCGAHVYRFFYVSFATRLLLKQAGLLVRSDGRVVIGSDVRVRSAI